jgi:hypothetical protein
MEATVNILSALRASNVDGQHLKQIEEMGAPVMEQAIGARPIRLPALRLCRLEARRPEALVASGRLGWRGFPAFWAGFPLYAYPPTSAPNYRAGSGDGVRQSAKAAF